MDERDDTLPAGWADAPIVIGRLVVQRGDGTEWSVEFDRALWVEWMANAATSSATPTRIAGASMCASRTGRYVHPSSVYEFTAISAEARYWLRGFLTGYEPAVDEYLGREDPRSYDPTHEEWVRYRTSSSAASTMDPTSSEPAPRPRPRHHRRGTRRDPS